MACRSTIRYQPTGRTQRDGDMLMAAASSQGALVSAFDFSNGSVEFNAVAFQLVFSTTLLYYTYVKFNQEKN
jgi:hypothetical protein